MFKLFKKAFTLIELLVVIAIIGILSGLIVVSMSGVTEKANIAKAQAFSNSLRNSLMLNIISEWKFDGSTSDGSVATANDVIDGWNNENNGTPYGSLVVKTKSNCINGSCLQFDGSDDYVDFGEKTSLDMGTDDATISFWVRFDNNIPTQADTMFFNGGSSVSAGQPGYWIFRENATNLLMGRFSDGSAGRVSGGLSPSTALTGNTWYNIVVVFDRNGVMQAHINGTKQTQSLNISSQQNSVNNFYSYRVGASSASANRLTGRMDEIRLYNTILPTSQIKEQYYLGLNKLLASEGISQEEYQNRTKNLIAHN